MVEGECAGTPADLEVVTAHDETVVADECCRAGGAGHVEPPASLVEGDTRNHRSPKVLILSTNGCPSGISLMAGPTGLILALR